MALQAQQSIHASMPDPEHINWRIKIGLHQCMFNAMVTKYILRGIKRMNIKNPLSPKMINHKEISLIIKPSLGIHVQTGLRNGPLYVFVAIYTTMPWYSVEKLNGTRYYFMKGKVDVLMSLQNHKYQRKWALRQIFNGVPDNSPQIRQWYGSMTFALQC